MDNKLKQYTYFFDESLMTGIETIALVENPATEVVAIQLSEQIAKIEFSVANLEERLLVAPLLIPNQPIYRENINGEPAYVSASAETIKAVQEYYMKMGNQNNSNVEHKGPNIDGITFVQHWLVRDSEMDTINAYSPNKYPIGTWVTVAKLSQELWDEYIKSGKVKGLSVEGLLGIKQVSMNNENNNNINKLKMNKNTIQNVILAAIKSVRLASDLVKFVDGDGREFYATSLELGSIITDADGNLVVETEFVIEDKKYSTDEMGAIESIDDAKGEQADAVIVEEPATETELADEVIVDETPAEVVVVADDVQALKDKIAELEAEKADLEAKNIELEAKLVQAEEAKVEMSKQTPSTKGLKDAPVAYKSNKGETMIQTLARLRK